MEFDREAKNMIAIMALVAAIAVGINAVVVNEPNQSFMGWSVGLFVVAILFWIWIRRDDVAANREDALQAAEDAAHQAEELAKKAQDKVETKIEAVREKIVVSDEDVKDSSEVIEEALEDEPEPVAEAPAIEPVVPATPDEPDDLSKIEGIGPVYQSILKDAGVGTFAAIAAKKTEELEAIIKDAGKRRPASINTWAEQAGLAAKGDWDGLQTLQDSLDGGRRV